MRTIEPRWRSIAWNLTSSSPAADPEGRKQVHSLRRLRIGMLGFEVKMPGQ